jgi:hypothetical protein
MILFNPFKKKEQKKEGVFSYVPDPSLILCKCNFNDDLCNWTARGPTGQDVKEGSPKVEISLTSETKHSGSSCLKVTGRHMAWHGARLDIAKYTREGLRDYEAMVWVKVPDDAPSCKVSLSLETNSQLGGVVFPFYEQWNDYSGDNMHLSKFRLPVGGIHADAEEWEINYPPDGVTDDGWVLLHGKIRINRAEHFRSFVYIETNNQGMNSDIYIDDFILLKGSALRS